MMGWLSPAGELYHGVFSGVVTVFFIEPVLKETLYFLKN